MFFLFSNPTKQKYIQAIKNGNKKYLKRYVSHKNINMEEDFLLYLNIAEKTNSIPIFIDFINCFKIKNKNNDPNYIKLTEHNYNHITKKIENLQDKKRHQLVEAILKENYLVQFPKMVGGFSINCSIINYYAHLKHYDMFVNIIEQYKLYHIHLKNTFNHIKEDHQYIYRKLIESNSFLIDEILKKQNDYFNNCEIYQKNLIKNKIKKNIDSF